MRTFFLHLFSARSVSSADRDELGHVFRRYAQHEHLGERYMTPNEFLQNYLGYLNGENIDPTTLNILSALVDLNKDGRQWIFQQRNIFVRSKRFVQE